MSQAGNYPDCEICDYKSAAEESQPQQGEGGNSSPSGQPTQQGSEPKEIFSQDVCSYCQRGPFMSCKDEKCKSVMSGRIAFNGKKLLPC